MDLNEVIKDLQEVRVKGRHRFWYPFMRKYNCKHVCELGVREGRNFIRMIDHRPKLAVAVDCWIDDGVQARNDIGLNQDRLDQQYESFKALVGYKPYVKICRGYTFDVVKEFPDEYFDFIYIDADHTYEGCKRDIDDWYLKLKHGGFLIGDDYRRSANKLHIQFGVIEAVKDFTMEHHLPFFMLPLWNWGLVKP